MTCVSEAHVGLIRVLTTDDEETLGAHGRVLEAAFPWMRTISRCIPDQPQGIFDDNTEQLAVPKIIRLAEEMADGLDALAITCAADPGLVEVRKVVSIPVVGAGSSGAAVAAAQGNRVAVLGLEGAVPRPIKSILGRRFLNFYSVPGMRTACDLLSGQGKQAVVDVARQALKDGADVILFGCCAMSSMGLAPLLRLECGVPVVDPVVAAGAMLWEAIRSWRA
ncbi:Asp/Glu/hydantoin racemase [Moorella mulderi DSM 14980]|uniref:Asp/Glu/hydantoin racemase n=1 Tax=Moorella mulderi DSM 14980 TaxID=1122241 RepID=A0A151AVP7_9FIRM|nr:Asp/Glu/hydantoin racemase [Moorella mulderi DSM 14980]